MPGYKNRPPGGDGAKQHPKEREAKVEPKMIVGTFYDLDPPARVASGIFHKVRCHAWHLSRPNDYIVSGIPQGGQKEKSFVLHFTDEGVIVKPSAEQKFEIQQQGSSHKKLIS